MRGAARTLPADVWKFWRTARGAFAGLLVADVAAAASLEPAPERFVVSPSGLPAGVSCQSAAADPSALLAAGLRLEDAHCRPDQAAFANYVSELGFAIAPTAFHPARTTGVAGWSATVEASFTHVGAGHDAIAQVFVFKVRKGLPFGFEVAPAAGVVANAGLLLAGADLRWAAIEGLSTRALGPLPDVALGCGVRTAVGSPSLSLTAIGVDVRVSRPFVVKKSATLVPSIGYQRLVIVGESGAVDATPGVDPLAQCGYEGTDSTTGAPRCRNKLANGADANFDFGNTFAFEKVKIHRHRGMLAMNGRYDVGWVGGQISFDITNPRDENPFLVGSRQWTLSVEGGVYF